MIDRKSEWGEGGKKKRRALFETGTSEGDRVGITVKSAAGEWKMNFDCSHGAEHKQEN